MSDTVHLLGEDAKLPPFVINDGSPVLPLSQTVDWGVNKLGVTSIHAAGITGKGIKVAVLDTKIDVNHPDLAGAVIEFINVTSEPTSVAASGHGIGVAGCIGARDNSSGVLGVAPGCQIIAIKVMREAGSGSISDIVKGIDIAIAKGAQIINMSLGTSSDVPEMKAAVKRATDKGIHVVCAAGNDGTTDSVNYPGKYPTALAIAATNSAGNVSAFSSLGWDVDLASPGEKVLVPWKNNGYATVSGTSFASPYCAGVLALFLEAKLQVTHQRLYDTAIDLGEPGQDTASGWGLINPNGFITRFTVPEPSESLSPSASVSPSEKPSASPSASESSSGSPSSSESPSESPSESLSVSPSPSAPIPAPIEKVAAAHFKAVEVVKLLEEFLSV